MLETAQISVMLSSFKIFQILEKGRGRGPVHACLPVVFLRFLIFPEPVMADTELNTGKIAVAVF